MIELQLPLTGTMIELQLLLTETMIEVQLPLTETMIEYHVWLYLGYLIQMTKCCRPIIGPLINKLIDWLGTCSCIHQPIHQLKPIHQSTKSVNQINHSINQLVSGQTNYRKHPNKRLCFNKRPSPLFRCH